MGKATHPHGLATQEHPKPQVGPQGSLEIRRYSPSQLTSQLLQCLSSSIQCGSKPSPTPLFSAADCARHSPGKGEQPAEALPPLDRWPNISFCPSAPSSPGTPVQFPHSISLTKTRAPYLVMALPGLATCRSRISCPWLSRTRGTVSPGDLYTRGFRGWSALPMKVDGVHFLVSLRSWLKAPFSKRPSL